MTGWRWLGSVLGLVLALVGVTATGLVLLDRDRAVDRLDADRASAVRVARDVVAGMVTIDGPTAASNLDRISGETTEPLRGQLTSFSKVFETILRQGQVRSAGSVGDAGVERIDSSTATVLLSVNATVKNSQVPNGAVRSFRMVVALRSDGGRWLASSVDVQA
ncbi:MAG: Mce-associated rane protein [Pseudonocardiales bacterium]|nr:Mce-associated rane protein [Pseudonocardiales bacterium]MDT7625428.1 Mce-associated rane protein [Pseudonocardiales bacterium]MDT7635210.1 Mce-associated rane protein [Pseudonocardiales bacterium]MDT7643293.1 Mce-associated rane protein [Pseudonocardiales bacterium]MDT7678515.1 Mce-associated rane protein [Pseudonocardiales bacterium]